jgi:hypothetical protein
LTQGEASTIEKVSQGAKKIVVAIHGMGDQYRNSTVQTVVSAFGKFARSPAGVPLGTFHSSGALKTFQLKGPPPPAAPLDTIGFIEVYWADIPRALQKEGYIIEESKAWARTVVERVRSRFGLDAHNLDAEGPEKQRLRLDLHHEDYFAGADAIEEMIETFAVLGNLLFIAEKAGVLKFDLDQLLTATLGDVQIVAEFAQYRRDVLDRFHQVLAAVQKGNADAEIYVIAHSEGTVVAFMGLLEAMGRHQRLVRARPDAAPDLITEPLAWVKQLRGFMTIGSPIDKHLILWPDIWDDLQKPFAGLEAKIEWRNYYDYGDPVGFRLDTARAWMKDWGWKPFFNFEDKHDYGFGRYLLPGAAHNDYWQDDEVFGHFIHTVMKLEVPLGGGSFDQPPGSKPVIRFGCNVIPYLLVFGILWLGSYLIYKGMIAYVAPGQPPVPALTHPAREPFWDVTGISSLLFGMIALARIPRVTRSGKWIAVALGAFGLGAASYAWMVRESVHRWHAMKLFDADRRLNTFVFSQIGETARVELHSHGLTGATASGAFIIALALAVAGFAAWGSRQDLRNWTCEPWATLRQFFAGARALIFPGSVCVLGIVAYRAVVGKEGAHALWPLFLAGAAFLYLWWLATLVFDLVFVWHRYIRRSVAQNYLFALRKRSKERRAKK